MLYIKYHKEVRLFVRVCVCIHSYAHTYDGHSDAHECVYIRTYIRVRRNASVHTSVSALMAMRIRE